MKIAYEKHQHLSFDLWLTLIKSNPEFKSKRNLLFRDFFEIDLPIEKVAEKVRYYDVLCNTMNEKVGLNIDTFEIYLLILNALDVKISAVEIEKLHQFYDQTEVLFLENKPFLMDENCFNFFKEVESEGKTMNILSNTGFIKGKTLRKLLEFYDLNQFFSFQIYSDEVGFSKPNEKIFQLIWEQTSHKLTKKEILHIGDNLVADYNGAKKFGFDAFLI